MKDSILDLQEVNVHSRQKQERKEKKVKQKKRRKYREISWYQIHFLYILMHHYIFVSHAMATNVLKTK